ncbi:MAG TPA: UbiD family decarboxylase [Alphaproteobacteria bacterium]|nr:UbiD family decarboxylase [Alphaproteobacteria bacterium]
MPDQSIRTLLGNLEQQGEMIRFDKQVDPLTNMAAVEWKAYNALGKSSLFTNIAGHDGWQACSQILADRKKWSIGLGIDEDELLAEMGRRVNQHIASVEVGKDQAPVRELIFKDGEVDLGDIPAMITSDKDGGRYLAAGMVFVKDPETGIANVSVHRMQITGKDKTGLLMLPRHARRIYDKYCARGEAMPAAVAIGAHPAIWYGSAFTTEFGIDEMSVAGGLLGEPVRMVQCETIDARVPAEAEIVLEGEILPNHSEPEGPFGEVPGTYAERGESEVFKVTCITRRKKPIYYAIHCGFPVTDTQATTGLGIEIATREHIKNVEGGLDLLDVRSVREAGLLAIVIKLRPRFEGQAKTALMAALSGPYLHPKLAIAVDDDIDASDMRQIMWSMTTRVHAERDVVMIPNTRVFPLDNVSPIAEGQNSFHRVGTKWLIDATKPALSQPEQRARFERAMPKNFDDVNLEDFLP